MPTGAVLGGGGGAIAGGVSGLIKCSKGTGAGGCGGQTHHIATDKNIKGGFTAQLKKIFDKAGVSMQDGENLIKSMPGHGGTDPPSYHQMVLDRLNTAVDGLSGGEAKAALIAELRAIRRDILSDPSLIKWKYWGAEMKRWFWVVGCDNTTADPYVADSGELECDDRDLRVCSKVESWSGTAWVKATTPENDGEPDDALQTCFSVPIYSRRLRNALEASGVTGVQYLPISVFRPNGELIPGFSVANVLNCVDALDLRLSAVSRFPEDYFIASRQGQIRGISAPVLIDHVIAPYDIIRLSTYPVSLYVSDRFVTIFNAEHFTGYSFHEVSTSKAV